MILTGIGLVLELGFIAIFVGAIVASFFVKRHRESSTASPNWVRTDEVFRDPSTQRIMRVWVDPTTGDRNYVPES